LYLSGIKGAGFKQMSETKTITISLVEYEGLLARMSALERRVEELMTENTELRAKNAALEETVLSLRQRLFGKKKIK
jgi:cell division protein FtsB